MTTQPVGVSLRITAGLTDVFLAMLPLGLMFAVGLFLTDMGRDPRQATESVLRLLPWWALLYLSTEAFFGWTLGKRATGLVIRAIDGGPASRRALLVRWASKYVWVLITPVTATLAPALAPHVATPAWLVGLGGFFLASRPSRQALWDVLARTAVYPRNTANAGRPAGS